MKSILATLVIDYIKKDQGNIASIVFYTQWTATFLQRLIINPSRSGIDFCLFKEIDMFHLLNIYFRDIWDYLLRGDYELPCCCGSHGSFTTAISLSGWLYWVDTGQTPKTHLHQQDRLKPSCWIIFLTRKALGLSSSSSSSTS